MIKSFIVSDTVGLLATNKQFVLLINDEIHGPFKINDWEKIAKILKEEK